MAKVWRIMPAHYVARIQPIHTYISTPTTYNDYPGGNARTLDPNRRGRLSRSSPSYAVYWGFDRGTTNTNRNTIDCLFLAGCASKATTSSLSATDYSGAPGTGAVQTLLSSGSHRPDSTLPTLRTFDSGKTTTDRSIELKLEDSASQVWEIGTLSFGKQYLLGPERFGSPASGTNPGTGSTLESGYLVPGSPRLGIRRRTWFFGRVDADTADSIYLDWARRDIPYTDGDATSGPDGYGGGAGSIPIVMAEFASETDQTSSGEGALFGKANISMSDVRGPVKQMRITMDVIPLAPVQVL